MRRRAHSPPSGTLCVAHPRPGAVPRRHRPLGPGRARVSTVGRAALVGAGVRLSPVRNTPRRPAVSSDRHARHVHVTDTRETQVMTRGERADVVRREDNLRMTGEFTGGWRRVVPEREREVRERDAPLRVPWRGDQPD